jgi:hypothetical protein
MHSGSNGHDGGSDMIQMLALGVVGATALYFLVLGVVSLLAPAKAGAFLLGFAATAALHYLELALRLAVGTALVAAAPALAASGVFAIAGWVLLVTTAGLLLVPWRWHRRFATHVVPMATRHLTLIGLASLALAGLMLGGLIRGPAS